MIGVLYKILQITILQNSLPNLCELHANSNDIETMEDDGKTREKDQSQKAKEKSLHSFGFQNLQVIHC